MLYKVSPFGYFSRTSKVSKGPWFQEREVEDDGLEYYYVYNNGGVTNYLLTNNIPIADREKMAQFYRGIQRHQSMALFAGLWLGVETVLRVPYFRTMAIGWRVVSVFGLGYLYKQAINAHTSMFYGPVLAAFIRKHGHHGKADLFDITDRKREYFELDTSGSLACWEVWD